MRISEHAVDRFAERVYKTGTTCKSPRRALGRRLRAFAEKGCQTRRFDDGISIRQYKGLEMVLRGDLVLTVYVKDESFAERERRRGW